MGKNSPLASMRHPPGPNNHKRRALADRVRVIRGHGRTAPEQAALFKGLEVEAAVEGDQGAAMGAEEAGERVPPVGTSSLHGTSLSMPRAT